MIQNISSQDTYVVRHPVLRSGKPLETCRFDGDDLPTTQHFGFFEKGKIIGIKKYEKGELVSEIEM